MIQIKKHSECQNSVFEKSTYGAIKFRAILIEKFPNNLLSNILAGMTNAPVHQLMMDMPERQFLLQEIKAACQRNKWDHPENHFIVMGYGVGQILTRLQPLGKAEEDDEENVAGMLIQRYADVFCIMDTDLQTDDVPIESGYHTKTQRNNNNTLDLIESEEEVESENTNEESVVTPPENLEQINAIQHRVDQEQAVIQQTRTELAEAHRIAEHHREIIIEQDQRLQGQEREIRHLREALAQLEVQEESPRNRTVHEESSRVPSTQEITAPPGVNPNELTYDVRRRDVQAVTSNEEQVRKTLEEMKAEITALRVEREELARMRQEREKPSLFSFENDGDQTRRPRSTLSLIRSHGKKTIPTPGVTFESRDFKTSTRSPKGITKESTLPTNRKKQSLPKPKFLLPEEQSEVDTEMEETTSEEEQRLPETPRVLSTTSKIFGQGRRSSHTTEKEQKKPYKAWTLKQLGIRQFDPDRNDLLSHIERVSRILEEVNVTPESQKIRLLMASFPEQLDYYEKVVSNENKSNYQKFAQELLAIMGSKVRITAHQFMQCHRNPAEDVLHYFFRITDLYKGSQGLMGDAWQDEPVHANHIYTKLFQSLYEPERAELERKLDRYIERGKLTVARLKKELIRINKMATTKIKAEAPNKRSILTVQAETPEEETTESRMKNVRCYYCNEPGHFRSECHHRQRQLASESANWKPNNYNYSSRGRGTLFYRGRGRGYNSNWRQPTRPPWRKYSALPEKDTESTQVRVKGEEAGTTNNEE